MVDSRPADRGDKHIVCGTDRIMERSEAASRRPPRDAVQAVEFLDSNAGEPVIGLGQWMMSPETMIQHFNMGYSFADIMDEPRLLVRDEEATLHSLAGGLNTIIEVYDVGANEIVTFQPSRLTPSRSRWIIRYPNGMYGAALETDAVGNGPEVLPDRGREEVQREPTRPDEAQGAGHYT